MSDIIVAAVIGGIASVLGAAIGLFAKSKNGKQDILERKVPTTNKTKQFVSIGKNAAINVGGDLGTLIVNEPQSKPENDTPNWLNERGVFSLRRDVTMYNWTVRNQKDYFDFGMEGYRYLLFDPTMNPVVLRYVIVFLNDDIVREKGHEDLNLLYPIDKDFSPVRIVLPLETEHLVAKGFDCGIVFGMQTISGHNYKQVIELSFSREDGFWKLNHQHSAFFEEE